ncbi:MAG: hypothetical protein EKK57_11410 [Proteobacteria bacterium]|nr:MAG: hypothetical protein EKK57_11410 [Pseudomonadota bacterium]
MKYTKYLLLLTLALTFTYFGNAQVENMHVYATRNELPGQTVWSGTAVNPSPGVYPDVRKKYSVFSSFFNWNFNGYDTFNVVNYSGGYESFWLRPTPGRPNRQFGIRVTTPGVTVNFNGFVLSYTGMSSFTWPVGQPFSGNIIFNSNTSQFQQVIFSAIRD